MNFLVQHGPALAIGIPLFTAFSTLLVSGFGEKARQLWVLAGLAIAAAAAGLTSFNALTAETIVYTLGAALPSLSAPGGFPIRIVLVADAASSLFATLALGIALAAAAYSTRFLKKQAGLEKFYSLLLLMAAGVAGIALTADFFTLFVFLEVASVSSAGLVAFYARGESFEAAYKYMVVSATAALFLLFGVGLIYGQAGALNMAEVAKNFAAAPSIAGAAALTLIAAALLMKAGSFPVHLWKPDAYQVAPAPVAAVLVTASLACLYALFRICFLLAGTLNLNHAFGWVIALLGAASIFIGVTMALAQSNIKRALGYAAVAEVGYASMATGVALAAFPIASETAVKALSGGIFQMLNDALDLGLLFMAAGAVLYLTKRGNLEGVSGIAHHSPLLAGFFLLGVFAIAGLPPFNGFASKLLIYESVYKFSPILSIAGIAGSIAMLAVFAKAFSFLFLGAPYKGKVERVPKTMLAAMGALSFFIIAFGLFPGTVLESVVEPAAQALANAPAYMGAVL